MARRFGAIVVAWVSIAALSASINYARGSALVVGLFVILALVFGFVLASAITSIGKGDN